MTNTAHTPTQHWTRNLPEVGMAIVGSEMLNGVFSGDATAANIEAVTRRISELEREVARWKKYRSNCEQKLLAKVRNSYTAEEIAQARTALAKITP